MIVVTLVPALHELPIGDEREKRVSVLYREIRQSRELLKGTPGE
nr:hypothetical protein [Catenulispora rubra]